MVPRIRHVLFDFDQVLARYRHERRIAHLADTAGCAHERVREVLFTSGLEAAYDSGLLDTATYLARLGDGIGAPVDEAHWIASRMAGSDAARDVLVHVEGLAPEITLGILTNNGGLMADAIPRILGPGCRRFEGRILCSGALQLRKPDPAVFRRALDRLGWQAGDTLFVDDSFANVQAARTLGIHADTVKDGRSLRRVLKRHGLA
ncbi:hydrolase [Luteimonas aestuarii]|uniref:Hydrolase n=1 Tax=Luteimonas aestuarii TaxID=453837 RepID=A0A4R5TSJ9_9GAMM|nr:HAD-IA family hydrolase [Luteimonas aestuarii]TDK23237.1 hydrolase [Luteimonas aestuarii]